MGQITINTPQGPAIVDIAGDTISQDELNRLRELAPPTEGEVFEYTVIKDDPAPEPEPEPEPEIDGEIEDNSLRFQVARGDDDEEKAVVLTELLGDGTFERVGEDTFVVDQSKVAPEIRAQYGLGDTGKVYVDKPGFTSKDFIDFAGESGPATAAAVGASLVMAGSAVLPAMLVVGGAAAGFKAIDEGIEWLQGRNRQSAGEVASTIAIEGVLNAVFEGGGRYVAKGIGRLYKGPGAVPSAARISEIQQTAKVSERVATKYAKAEALAAFNEMAKKGAAPTIEAATGKSLAARILAINEKIMPNPKVGRRNVNYIEQILADLQSGSLSKKEAQALMKSEYDAVASALDIKMADPEKMFGVIQSHLDDVVKVELKAFEDAFVPATGAPSQYVESVKLAANLFRAESSAAYDMAQKQIGKDYLFDLKPLTETIKRLDDGNRFISYSGSLFKEIAKADKGLGISDLVQLKQALRLSAGNPELVANAAQAGVGQIIKSVDEVLDSTFTNLSRDVTRGYQILRHPAGSVDSSGKKIGGKYYKSPFGPVENESLRQGLATWKKANAAYTKGQEEINNVAVNTIVKNSRDGFYNSNIDVVKQIVEAGNAPKLRMYLNAATPSPTGAAKISKPGALETIDQIKSLVEGSNPNFQAASDLIEGSGLSDILPKLSPWIAKLPVDDVFRTMHVEQYLKEMDSLSALAQAGANPQAVRESVRNGLAEVWIEGAKGSSEDLMGRFAPGKFASSFSALEKETQDLLFGVSSASRMREVMGSFRMLGKTQDEVLDFAFTDPGAIPKSIKAQIQAFREAVESATEASDDALGTAIRQGQITNPADLVTSILNPKSGPANYTRLRNAVGDEQLSRLGGVKDMVTQNLIRNSFNKLDEASIQSGKWGGELQKNILKQNENGALDTILGKDVVSKLTTIAEEGVKISDVPIKGYGGLAAATGAIAVATGLVTLNLAIVGAAVGTLLPVVVLSRLLRNKGILSSMTSPRLRAKEYEEAIKAGADLPAFSSVDTFYLNRLASIATTEATLVAGSGLGNVPISESGKAFEEQQRTGVSPRQGRPYEGLPPLAASPSFEGIRQQLPGVPVPGQAQQAGADALRQIEENKLMGVGANQ